MRLFIILLIALALLAVLVYTFPYANLSGQDRTQMFINLTMLLLFGSSVFVSFSGNLKGMAGKALIWVTIFLGLIVLYSFKPQFMDVKERISAQLFPHDAVVEGQAVYFRKSDDGHFHIKAMVNGKPVIFLLDTGATNIVLSPQDAERLGVPLQELSYNQVFYTANGRGRGASIRLDTIQVGSIHLTQMPASVNEAEMGDSLLGMRFLEKLHSYSVQGDTLVLVP